MKFKFLVLLSCIFGSALCAGSKCIDDIQHYDLLKGRNAWARKCGYIPRKIERYFNETKKYVTFDTVEGRVYNAPTDERMPCVKLQLDGACVLQQ